MWKQFVQSPLVFLFLLLSVVLSIAIGFWATNKVLLPVLNISFAYPVLFTLLAEDQRKKAYLAMLFWALCMGIVMVNACLHYPVRAAASIFNGTSYVQEMFHWIKTGEGAEGDPLKFVPVHLLHIVVFCLLSAASASLLSLLMGALLMNYMSFYVASLILASHDSTLAMWMGWHPWSAIRVASFVILGVILGEPMVCKITKRDYEYTDARPFMWAAIGGLILDVLMKALLAPWWGLTLRKLLS
jgi:hypothetical protein